MHARLAALAHLASLAHSSVIASIPARPPAQLIYKDLVGEDQSELLTDAFDIEFKHDFFYEVKSAWCLVGGQTIDIGANSSADGPDDEVDAAPVIDARDPYRSPRRAVRGAGSEASVRGQAAPGVAVVDNAMDLDGNIVRSQHTSENLSPLND